MQILQDFEIKETVKDLVEQMVNITSHIAPAPRLVQENKPSAAKDTEIEGLKQDMSLLVNLLQNVKMANDTKQEEIKFMKSKMDEMEQALSGNATYGKSLLMREFVNSPDMMDKSRKLAD